MGTKCPSERDKDREPRKGVGDSLLSCQATRNDSEPLIGVRTRWRSPRWELDRRLTIVEERPGGSRPRNDYGCPSGIHVGDPIIRYHHYDLGTELEKPCIKLVPIEVKHLVAHA